MSQVKSISMRLTGQFSELIDDYLGGSDFLDKFIVARPSLESLLERAKNRRFSKDDRIRLVAAIEQQYDRRGLPFPQQAESLLQENCFTVTTGHQLNLLGGPLYTLLKAASAIRLANDLTRESDQRFIPVYWMATEDHDFEEINHLYLYGKKVEWNSDQKGAVGRFDLADVKEALEQVEQILGSSFDGQTWEKIRSCYEANDLASAHARLFHELFAEHGLIILDGDDHKWKKTFAPLMLKEVTDQVIHKHVSAQNEVLSEKYKPQAHAREINLFHLVNGRVRIEEDGDGHKKVDDSWRWGPGELEEELRNMPANFSPNVLFRPVYQELVLPNVAYIGGGGELAYWMQLKNTFEAFEIDFPILVLRSSVALVSSKQWTAWTEAGLTIQDVFEERHILENRLLEQMDITFSLDAQREKFQAAFKEIEERLMEIDGTLANRLRGDESKLDKALDQLEKKAIKAYKQKHEKELRRTLQVHDKVLPEGKLSERRDNFLQYYHAGLPLALIEACDPLSGEFHLIISE